MHIENAQSFSDAVMRIRKKSGLYQLRENTVAVDQQTLFRTSIEMPANLEHVHFNWFHIQQRQRSCSIRPV